MGFFLRLGSYVFHPLILPVVAWGLYIIVQPNYPTAWLLQQSYKSIFLFTLILPVFLWVYLKLRKRIADWEVSEVKQRRIPLFLYAASLTALLYMGQLDHILPIKAFIYGVLTTSITCWLLTFLEVKVSLHQAAISGLMIFSICLSIFFQWNLLVWICVLIFANGWVASSRLYLEKHTFSELILGFLMGGLPQLYLVAYWL